HHNIVGYNVNFDINFLYDNLLECRDEKLSNDFVDVMRIAKRVLPGAKDISTEKTEFNESHPLFGKVCVFTGKLEKMQRKEAMQLVADLGGIPGDRVTKKTSYLILGNNDYCKTIKDGKSSKQK